MIRTSCIELYSIPAFAYKEKLNDEKCILTIIRLDKNKKAIFSMSKQCSKIKPLCNIEERYFSFESVCEAVQRLEGWPFFNKNNFKLSYVTNEKITVPKQEKSIAELFVNSVGYKSFIQFYMHPKGFLDIERLNEDLIRMASQSQTFFVCLKKDAVSIDMLLQDILRQNILLVTGLENNYTNEEIIILIELLQNTTNADVFNLFKHFMQNIK